MPTPNERKALAFLAAVALSGTVVRLVRAHEGAGAQILRDLGVTSIRHLTSSVHDYKGLSGFGIEIVANEQLET